MSSVLKSSNSGLISLLHMIFENLVITEDLLNDLYGFEI
jgi:hypothetical protein